MYMRVLALSLVLFAPMALACSITASGNCGGSACAAGESCTKTDEFTCKCVKNSTESDKKNEHKEQKQEQKNEGKTAPVRVK